MKLHVGLVKQDALGDDRPRRRCRRLANWTKQYA